jgi:hypothetical protein
LGVHRIECEPSLKFRSLEIRCRGVAEVHDP